MLHHNKWSTFDIPLFSILFECLSIGAIVLIDLALSSNKKRIYSLMWPLYTNMAIIAIIGFLLFFTLFTYYFYKEPEESKIHKNSNFMFVFSNTENITSKNEIEWKWKKNGKLKLSLQILTLLRLLSATQLLQNELQDNLYFS